MAVLLLQVFPVFIGIAVTLLVAVTFLNAQKSTGIRRIKPPAAQTS